MAVSEPLEETTSLTVVGAVAAALGFASTKVNPIASNETTLRPIVARRDDLRIVPTFDQALMVLSLLCMSVRHTILAGDTPKRVSRIRKKGRSRGLNRNSRIYTSTNANYRLRSLVWELRHRAMRPLNDIKLRGLYIKDRFLRILSRQMVERETNRREVQLSVATGGRITQLSVKRDNTVNNVHGDGVSFFIDTLEHG